MYHKAATIIFIFIFSMMFVIPVAASETDVLSGRVIILDPGHGDDTANFFQGYNEPVVMLKLAEIIKSLLEEHGATVHLTRTDSVNVPLSTRIALTNIWSLELLREIKIKNTNDIDSINDQMNDIAESIKIMHKIISNPDDHASVYFNTPFARPVTMHPDLQRIFELQSDPDLGERILFISLHSNATGTPINTNVRGADVFHVSNTLRDLTGYYTDYSHYIQSMHFGEILLDLIHDTGIQRRSVSHANFFVLREHNLPAVLVENGYHTNPRDRANLMNDDYLLQLAHAYLEATIAFYADKPLPAVSTEIIDSIYDRIQPDLRYPIFRFDFNIIPHR